MRDGMFAVPLIPFLSKIFVSKNLCHTHSIVQSIFDTVWVSSSLVHNQSSIWQRLLQAFLNCSFLSQQHDPSILRYTKFIPKPKKVVLYVYSKTHTLSIMLIDMLLPYSTIFLMVFYLYSGCMIINITYFLYSTLLICISPVLYTINYLFFDILFTLFIYIQPFDMVLEEFLELTALN